MRTPTRLLPAIFIGAALAGCNSRRSTHARSGLDLPPVATQAPRECAFDVQSYALDLELLPEARALRGTCRVRVFPRNANLTAIDLDLDDLDVTAVRDDRGRSLTFDRRPGLLHVVLPGPVEPGDCAEIEVAYGGAPRKGMYFTAPRGGVPTQVFTQGECEDSRGWFPCCDTPSDRALSEIRVTMPERWTAVAAGERIERTENGGKATELWRMSTPHPAYLTTLVAGELEARTSTSPEGVPLVELSRPDLAQRLDANLGDAGAVLAAFGSLTGRAYPYPKYSQACVDDFCFGGMENISATTLTDTCLLDDLGRKDSPQTGLVAHEAAHQWFGDLMTCRDWSHVWLNEGFATYFAALYAERASGVDAFRAQIRDLQEAYVAADVGPNRRPIVYATARRPMDLFFSGHAYGGAAVRLHLLRGKLGDDVFFRGIREYVARNAGRSVVTDDFRAAMEAASGEDLSGFFSDWFTSPGFPEFESSWRYDDKRKVVILSVDQVHEVAGGTPAVFRTPVEIGIRDAAGQRTVRLSIERRRHLFEIAAPEKPLFVRFDEHGFVPKRLEERRSLGEWTAIATQDDDVNGRREAIGVLGRVLAKAPAEAAKAPSTDTAKAPSGDAAKASPTDAGKASSGASSSMPAPSAAPEMSAAVAALLDRIEKDSSDVVRAAAAAALAGVRDPAARTALSKAASGDASAKVRVAALDALCFLGPDAELAALGEREYEAPFSWNTAASAAALLGSARPAGFGDWVLARIADPKTPDPLRGRLLSLLGRAKDPRALTTSLRIAQDPSSAEEVRAAAVREIGALGRGRAEARQALERSLAGGTFRIRREAAVALGALGDPSALDALREAHARTPLVPELRAIEAACRALETSTR
jgi:aminopeptidase N